MDATQSLFACALQGGSRMPRKLKLGRTGAKHTKPAAFDARRQPKAECTMSRAQETLAAALEAANVAIGYI